MTIEQHVWQNCKRDLTCDTIMKYPSRRRSRLQVLASVRSLIVNPSTTGGTISCILETLLQCLQQDQKPLHHHVLKLLADLAGNCDRSLSHVIFDALLAYAAAHKDASCLSVEAVAVLVKIVDQNQRSSFASAISELNDDFFLSLCLSSSVSVRSWLLFNASRFNVRPLLLANVMLEFTKDSSPYARRAALSGLVNLSEMVDTKETRLIKACYDRAVELLLDNNDCVRSAAVDVVSKWGHMLATSDNEVSNSNWSDAVFVQLCSVARDMNVEVRTKTFTALGKTKLVSEDILLQSLSKKVLGSIKERRVIDVPASNAAGVFVHGFEDEFYEVRRSACNSLGMLTIFSVHFADDSLTLLTDLLNDDTMVVRLQSLETMYHMATCDRLKVQRAALHMLIGTLVDANTLIRCAARNVLRLMKLTDLKMFKSSISGLLTNLESYPEDEADIFTILFNVGRCHGNFAVSFVREVSQEIGPSCEGELPLDKPRVAAILVVAIAALLSNEPRLPSIPTRIYTYAIPFLGRISRSLRGVLSQDMLLSYLSQFSSFMRCPTMESSREDEHFMHVVKEGMPSPNIYETINHVTPLRQISYGISESQSLGDFCYPRNTPSVKESQQELAPVHDEAIDAVSLILKKIVEVWNLIKSGCTYEVQRTLRSCKEELAIIAVDSDGSVSLFAFASQYIGVMQLLAKVWEHFMPSRKFHGSGIELLDLLLEKIDMNLKRMRYGFSGLSNEEELHILEIVLLIYVLRLSKAESCSYVTTLKRLRVAIARVEFLCDDGFSKLSDFASEVKKLFSIERASDSEAYHCPFPFKRLLELFSLKQFVFSGRFKYISAEVDAPGNNSENPVPFISGFPVGITFNITLRNVSVEDKFWLKMAVEELTQYVFLDLRRFEDCNDIRKLTLNVPFYRTPKTVSFSLRACIGKECQFEDVDLTKGQGGPKHELAFLCNEKEVYLVARR